MRREDQAFRSITFPINSLPFIKRLEEILDENETNSPESLPEGELHKFKANLHITLSQTFGQLYTVNAMDLVNELERT